MEVKITHPSKHLHSTALYNLAPATSLKAVPRLLHGHQLQPHRPFLFFPHTKITPTSECALDGPPPLPGMCFSQSPWGSLPSSLGFLLSGRSSWLHSPYPALFSSVVFIITGNILWIGLLYTHTHTHMHGSVRTRTLSILFTATSPAPKTSVYWVVGRQTFFNK